MKIFFVFVSCLFAVSSFAENIQQVKYQLPKAAENWVVHNKLENEKGTTIVYTPKEVEKQEAKEFFGVNANRLSINPNNSEALKLGLTKLFPNMKIDFRILEKDKDSVIYEWSAQENGAQKIHGLGRAFSTKEGSVVLGYQTQNISNIQQARSVWLQALKEAKQEANK